MKKYEADRSLRSETAELIRAGFPDILPEKLCEIENDPLILVRFALKKIISLEEEIDRLKKNSG